MRLLPSGDIHLNPGPFSHIRESDMLIDVVTKDCKKPKHLPIQCTQFKKQI